MVRTATAYGKLFLVKQTFGGEMLVQFMSVSDSISHSAVVRFYAKLPPDVGRSKFTTTTAPLSSLIEVDQEAAKAIWLIQTGEEL
jgi:hypothetical protein